MTGRLLNPASPSQSARLARRNRTQPTANPNPNPNPNPSPNPNSPEPEPEPNTLTLAEALFALLAAALISGGALDEDTAQKIGEAQRGFYPSPPGIEQAEAIKAKRAGS